VKAKNGALKLKLGLIFKNKQIGSTHGHRLTSALQGNKSNERRITSSLRGQKCHTYSIDLHQRTKYEKLKREHLANHFIVDSSNAVKLYKERIKWTLKANPANYAPTALDRCRSPYTSLLCFSFCLCLESICIFARKGSTTTSSSSAGACLFESSVWWW